MAYTGRFLDFVVEAVEHWFDEFFGLDWYDLNENMGFGTPFRHVELEFQDKLTPRDIVETELRISKVTRTTISFEILSYGNSKALGRRLCFTGKCTIVFVKFDTEKSAAIPDEFREKLEAAGFTD
ncbi:MAG: thioesterase family protein [Rhizobiales bacterium]|nr:thioesterase family protein [Hyphomicrobiales bacterium]